MPIQLTDEMRAAMETALADSAPVLVGTASGAGDPDVVFKGSVMVWDDEHLAFWERAHGMTLQNLKENPKVCLLYRNSATRLAWKFWGEAELHPEGELREAIKSRTIQLELDRDPEGKGIGVLIRIDKVTQLGKVIMERD